MTGFRAITFLAAGPASERSRSAAAGGVKMSLEVLRRFLLWCTVINYGILLVWFLLFTLAREPFHRFHNRWFRLSGEQFDTLHYAGMSVYKIGILLFNLVPYLALCLVG
jgi:hypothetical protein